MVEFESDEILAVSRDKCWVGWRVIRIEISWYGISIGHILGSPAFWE